MLSLNLMKSHPSLRDCHWKKRVHVRQYLYYVLDMIVYNHRIPRSDYIHLDYIYYSSTGLDCRNSSDYSSIYFYHSHMTPRISQIPTPLIHMIRISRSGYQDGILIFHAALENLPPPGRSASFYRDGFPPP